ncbi:MAG: sulfur carrier protein ThiS [Actinomycetes bacterium]
MRISINGTEHAVAPRTTLAELLSAHAAGGGRGVAVALDGEVVPRARHAGTPLHEGAQVEIVTAVQGG